MSFRLTSIMFVVLLMVIANTARAWEVDFSHHKRQPSGDATTEKVASNKAVPASEDGGKLPPQRPKSLDGFVEPAKAPAWTGDRQEFVILNTSKGFVPANVRIHKGAHYTVHIVNVNEDKKNVSFMLDAFNQHYATYFGQIKTFNLDPDKEGVYDFECPETNSTGKLVVFGPAAMPPAQMNRNVSSTSDK